MTQAIDFRFELLFVGCVLVSLIGLATAIALLIGGHRPAAWRTMKSLGVGWAGYLSIVIAVAAFGRQRAVPARQDLCFDEMCFAVVNVQVAAQLGPAGRPAHAAGMFYIVTVRVSSRARGKAQRELGLHAALWSSTREYQVSQGGQVAWDTTHPGNAALTDRVMTGQSVLSDQVFDVDSQAGDLGLVFDHGFGPGYFVIGECPLFHAPEILRLPRS